jgi:hypothetical protein
LVGEGSIKTGADEWHHVGLVWESGAGVLGKGEARLYVGGELVGKAEVPDTFDLSVSDRNAFRGLWIAGRATDEKGSGSENWGGKLDELIFRSGVMSEDEIAAALKPKEAPKPEVAKVEPKPKAPEAIPEPAKPAPKVDPAAQPVKPAVPSKPAPVVHEMRGWTDLRGTAMEASMVLSEGSKRAGRVILRTADDIEFSLPLERLSEADQAYVKEKGG